MKLHIITFLLNYEFDIKTDLHGFYDKIRIVKTLDKRRNNFLFLLTHIFFIYYVRLGSKNIYGIYLLMTPFSFFVVPPTKRSSGQIISFSAKPLQPPVNSLPTSGAYIKI